MFSRLFRSRVTSTHINKKKVAIPNKTYLTSRITNPNNIPSHLNNIRFGKDIFVSVNSYDNKSLFIDTATIPGFKNIDIDETNDKINITFITDQESQFNYFKKLLKEKDDKIDDLSISLFYYPVLTLLLSVLIMLYIPDCTHYSNKF